MLPDTSLGQRGAMGMLPSRPFKRKRRSTQQLAVVRCGLSHTRHGAALAAMLKSCWPTVLLWLRGVPTAEGEQRATACDGGEPSSMQRCTVLLRPSLS